MSWDIIIQDFPPDVQNVLEIPQGYQPKSLGTRDEVIARIQEVLPDVDFSNRSWGVLVRPGFSIEFNIGKKEICDGFGLHVRGGGSAIATIEMLLQHLQLRAVDCQTSDFFSHDAAQASFGQWQAYRDRCIRRENPSEAHPADKGNQLPQISEARQPAARCLGWINVVRFMLCGIAAFLNGIWLAFQGNGNWIWSGFILGWVLGLAWSALLLFGLLPAVRYLWRKTAKISTDVRGKD